MLNVTGSLPQGSFQPEGGEAVLQRMIGATIVRIGAPDDADLDGGGLVIDYRPAGSTEVWRAVLAFHEAGMWVVHDGALPTSDAVQE